jgi:hypothetical protein
MRGRWLQGLCDCLLYETMKAKIKKIFYLAILVQIILLLTSNNINGQIDANNKKYDIKKFAATVINSDYSMAYSVAIVITDKQLKIIYKSGLEGGKDTVFFSKSLSPSDTLQEISEINITKLKEYYSNNCIADGSQVGVILKKDNEIKAVHLSNYFQEDIGKIIYLVNSIVPDKYKVWYDKDTLIAEYKKCNGSK